MSKRSAVVVLMIVLASVGLIVARCVQRDSIAKPALESAALPEPQKDTQPVDLAASEPQEKAARAVVAPAAPTAPTSAAPAPATLKVHVVDKSSGRALAKVSVKVVSKAPADGGANAAAPVGWRDLTDSDGRLEFEFPGDVAIDVSVDGANAHAGDAHVEVAAIGAGKTFELEIPLRTDTDSIFWVRALDESTRDPIVDARLLSSDGGSEQAKADDRGLLSISIASFKSSMFRIEARDHAFVYVHSEASHDTAERALDITLPRSAIVDAHVVGARGAPLADAIVELSMRGYMIVKPESARPELVQAKPDPRWRKASDRDGHVVFDELPPNTRIELSITGQTTWRLKNAITLEPGERRDVECRVGVGSLVEGRVIDQFGKPVQHHSIRIEPAQYKMPIYFQSNVGPRAELTDTDDDGRFAFKGVGSGTWWIGPNAKREPHQQPDLDDVAPVAKLLEIVEGTAQTTVDIRVDRGLTIRGRVLDAQGAPATRGSVSAHAAGDAASPYTFVERDGSFTIGPIASGRFDLRARTTDGDADSDLVSAVAGDSDVVLRLKFGASLSGKVVDASGVAVIARVLATRVNDNKQQSWERYTTPEGDFELKGLDAGTLDLVATTSDGRVGILDRIVLDAGVRVKDLVIRVQLAGRVRVRYDGNTKHATVRVIVNGVTADTQSIDKGAAVEMTAPLGKVTLRMSVAGHPTPIDREIEVRVGETQEIVLSEGPR